MALEGEEGRGVMDVPLCDLIFLCSPFSVSFPFGIGLLFFRHRWTRQALILAGRHACIGVRNR